MWRVLAPMLIWLPPGLLVAPLGFLFVGAVTARWDSRGLSGFSVAGLLEGYGLVRDSILFSAALALASALLASTVAVPLAWAIQTRRSRLMGVVRELVALPVILPSALLAIGLMLAYPGLQGGWVILLIAHVAQTIPFALWPVATALLAFDAAALDVAARTLGAGPVQRFALVILPNVWRAAATGCATAFVISFSETGSSLFLGSAHYRPIGVVLVDSFLNLDQRISAAAAAIFTLILLPALVALELLLAAGRRRTAAAR